MEILIELHSKIQYCKQNLNREQLNKRLTIGIPWNWNLL